MNIEDKLLEWVEEFIKDSELFLVSNRVTPTNNYKYYIDGDNGFSLERSVEINRKMRRFIEEEGYYPDGNFSLEISSPGIDEPLKMNRQYKKNIGRLVLIELNTEEEEVEGRITDVSEEAILIEKKGTKKEAKKIIEIKFKDMKQATIQIEFKK